MAIRKVDAVVCLGQIREILPLYPGKLGIFLVSAPFLDPSLPGIGYRHSFSYFFEWFLNRAIISKDFVFIYVKFVIAISICKKAVFNYVFCKKPLKAPGH